MIPEDPRPSDLSTRSAPERILGAFDRGPTLSGRTRPSVRDSAIELQSEIRIVVGRLSEPADEDRPWWWQSSWKVEGVEVTVGGLARTDSDAILEAAARTLDLHVTAEPDPEPASGPVENLLFRVPRATDPPEAVSG